MCYKLAVLTSSIISARHRFIGVLYPLCKHILMMPYNRNVLFYIQVPPFPITVTIGLDWDVTSVGKPVPPPYTTQVTNGTALVDIMNKAADENTQGPFNRWASTYFAGLGHSIICIDSVEQVWLRCNNTEKWSKNLTE